MRTYGMAVLLGLLGASCCRPIHSENKAILSEAIGALSVENQSDEVYWIEVIMEQYKHRVGFVYPKQTKTMGFAKIAMGDRLLVTQQERLDATTEQIRVITFDSLELREIASEIKLFHFVLPGDGKWKLKVYRKQHGTEEERGLLKTVSAK